MTRLEFDTELVILSPIFGVAALISLGLVEPNIIPWFDISGTLVEFGGVEFSIARGAQIGALAAVVVNRDDPIWDELGAVEIWIVYATIGLIIAPPFFPIFEETLAQSAAGVAAFAAQSTGFGLVSFLN